MRAWVSVMPPVDGDTTRTVLAGQSIDCPRAAVGNASPVDAMRPSARRRVGRALGKRLSCELLMVVSSDCSCRGALLQEGDHRPGHGGRILNRGDMSDAREH